MEQATRRTCHGYDFLFPSVSLPPNPEVSLLHRGLKPSHRVAVQTSGALGPQEGREVGTGKDVSSGLR